MLAPLFDERPFHILTVTEVTRDIKDLLEDTFASVWVEGEISNWRVVQSGHAYFTLKDVHSQLRTVMFRSALRQLPFEPEAGMQVVAHGHLTVYEPRGDYQLLAEMLEPKPRRGKATPEGTDEENESGLQPISALLPDAPTDNVVNPRGGQPERPKPC